MTTVDIAAYEWQIIANPNALASQKKIVERVFLDELTARGIHYQFHTANGEKQGVRTAAELCSQGHRHFIIIGGDGTINEVINGIYESGTDTADVYVAIVPMGTGNDYCRTIQMPTLHNEILTTFFSGNFLQNDVGIVETLHQNQVIAKRHFVNIAGFGFDAAVIHKTVGKKPRFLPSMVYLFNLVKVLFGYQCTTVTIKTAQDSLTAPIFTIAVGIAQYNGNGMRQVPMANPHDRLFDIVAVKKISPWKVISKIKQLFSGEHVRTLPEAVVFQSDCVEIEAEQPVWGEVEGEMLMKGTYRIYNAPKQINILCPTETTK